MSDQQSVDFSAKIKDLEDENELLLLQLHQVQEELEVYFLKYKDLESGQSSSLASATVSQINWVDDELPEALAEVERLQNLSSVQAEIKEIESRNALNIKLGNMLLEASSSVGGISKLPFSLLSFWRNATKKTARSELGGKEYSEVIKAYEERGFVGVKSLLKGDEYSPVIKGNAYTALARYLMKKDAKAAAEAAEKAFESDPKAYRLKWLACRTHEAGSVLRAEAMLTLLPEGLTFSESEKKQISQIRYESITLRRRDARQKTQIVSKQQKMQAEISELTNTIARLTDQTVESEQQRSKLFEQMDSLKRDKDTVIEEKNRLHHEKLSLTEDNQRFSIQLQQLKNKFDLVSSEHQRKELESNKLLAMLKEENNNLKSELFASNVQSTADLENVNKALNTAIKAEKFLRALLEQEQVKNVVLVQARDEQTGLAQERQSQIEALTQAQSQLTQSRDEALGQIAALQGQLAEMGQTNAGLEAQKAGLEHEKTVLQQEIAALAQTKDEQTELAQERQNRIEALTQAQSQLTQTRDEALGQIAALQGQLAEMGQTNAGLEAQKAGLEHEKTVLQQEIAALAQTKDEQTELAQERQIQIEALTQEQGQLSQTRDEALGQIAALQGQLAEMGQTNASLEAQKAGLDQAQAALQQEKESLTNARNEIEKLAGQLQNDLRESRQTSSMSVKLQMLREADLNDLRSRFEESQLREEHQQELMARLGEKLKMISGYFRQLGYSESRAYSEDTSHTRAADHLIGKQL